MSISRLEAIRIAWVEPDSGDIEPILVTAQLDMRYLVEKLDAAVGALEELDRITIEPDELRIIRAALAMVKS